MKQIKNGFWREVSGVNFKKLLFLWIVKGMYKWIPSWKKYPSVWIGCGQICFERRNKENGRKDRRKEERKAKYRKKKDWKKLARLLNGYL